MQRSGAGVLPASAKHSALLDKWTTALQAAAEGLQRLLDRNALPDVPDYSRVQPGVDSARRLVTYAHKLSYTTFAPPGFEAGKTPLRNFRPPAPQDWQLRASLLHQFAAATKAAPSGAAAAVEAAPRRAAPPPPAPNSAFDFILNPDLEEVEEAFSSDEEYSDD
ncbi:hypothetical protein WJX81_001133 [Elliptochloris bilobata]|uniref:Mediator of RNA polymerase II transcription subunit 4 n=1 Tax=Elliptochloris bilobata TaxID=381761 RepID=A0AAW1RE09_9CHLO